MAERKKLKRIQRLEPYTTGDAQTWTYEYTWEDLETARRYPTAPLDCETGRIGYNILHQFYPDSFERLVGPEVVE